MLQGDLGPLGPVTQGVLIGLSVMMAIPSLMVFLSVALRSNRILNIVVGALFTLLLAFITYSTEWYFYKLFAGIEAVLTVLVVWYEWKWPRGVNTA